MFCILYFENYPSPIISNCSLHLFFTDKITAKKFMRTWNDRFRNSKAVKLFQIIYRIKCDKVFKVRDVPILIILILFNFISIRN